MKKRYLQNLSIMSNKYKIYMIIYCWHLHDLSLGSSKLVFLCVNVQPIVVDFDLVRKQYGVESQHRAGIKFRSRGL